MSETPTGAAPSPARPPRDELVRATRVGVEIRAADDGTGGMPTLTGHFSVFNTWTRIDSMWEGTFIERIAPPAFNKTFREQTPKVLFNHGMDPQIGDKVLGAPSVVRADEHGAYYEVPLLDTSYNRDLIPGLEAGLYGASFRFSVVREEWNDEPERSEHNPDGLPERTIKELRCSEFGPVTFPAYPDATAGVRSLTDEFIIRRATRDPERLRHILAHLDERASAANTVRPAGGDTDSDAPAALSDEEQERSDTAPSDGDAGAEPHLTDERRGPTSPPRKSTGTTSLYGLRRKEVHPSWRI